MSDSEEFERCKKRQKLENMEDSEGDVVDEALRANNHIFLTFPLLGEEAYHPEYTHQLFDEEQMDFLSDEEMNIEVSIDVDVRDLSFNVSFAGLSSHITRDMLLDGLRKGLPMDTSIEGEKQPGPKKSVPCPVGRKVQEFARKERKYAIYLATAQDPGASLLLHRGEKLAMYYIETADSVDFADPRWEVLFLYEDEKHVVGYLTLFTFLSPHAHLLRVCQALLLPARQAQGLGRELLRCVHLLARDRDSVREVNVEDPCPAFRALRDSVDLAWGEESRERSGQRQRETEEEGQGEEGAKEGLDKLKLTEGQQHIVEEVRRLVSLCQTLLKREEEGRGEGQESLREKVRKATGVGGEKEGLALLFAAAQASPLYSSLRLLAKRYAVHEEGALRALSQEERRRELKERFREREERYLRMLRTAVSIGMLKIR